MLTAFRPWLEERVIAHDDDVLVVDKPSGLPVHGGDPAATSDVVGRLRVHLGGDATDPYLGVHQRLDVGTSGVLLFVRRRELNAAVGADFAEGAARKVYVAAIEPRRGSPLSLHDTLELEHRLERDGKHTRVVASEGKPARASCRVIARHGARALVELRPRTGRTHQLRVQLADVGAPIAGDREYGGGPAPRLLLHAEALELPSLRRRFSAARPALFARWLAADTDALGAHTDLRQKLSDAACLRYPLLERNDAFRWVNGWGDELSGVVVDLYGKHAALSVSSAEATSRAQELAHVLAELGAEGVYLKVRAKTDLRRADPAALAPALPIVGGAAPEPLVVREAGVRIGVALGDGLSTGLFVDQRDNRKRIAEFARDARVLNLFSYTGAFSVAAAQAGAARVVSVDVSRRALERARENFALNGLELGPHAFVREDVRRYLTRAHGRGDRYDVVILDPPSFSSSGARGVLSIERDYETLVRQSLRVLAPRGRLLAVTNHRATGAALRRHVLGAARAEGVMVAQAKELAAGVDCPDGPDGPDPSRAVLLTLS